MDIQDSQKSVNTEDLDQQQVNSFCQNLISNNQVHSVHVQQEGEYLNINIKIKIDPAQMIQNDITIRNKGSHGQHLKKETPVTSTKLADGSLNINDSISYESFKEQLDPKSQKSMKKTPIMTNSTTLSNSPKVDPSKNIIPSQLQSGMKHHLKFRGKETSKLLAIMDNGEQRLITFVLPKTSFTVQELLDQVGIKINKNTPVECIENIGSEIDYLVKIGTFKEIDTKELIKEAENHVRQQKLKNAANFRDNSPPSKFLDGYYSVCSACEFHGLDLAKCSRCHRIYNDNDKIFRILKMSKV